MAEASGQIRALGALILKQACRETQALSQKIGRELTISVNVSPMQFVNGYILVDLRAALDTSGINPESVILEITEGVFLSHVVEASEVLAALVAMGVQLSMDDFGQGYSSLSYLRKHPFSYLKIDQFFIQGMEHSAQDYALVQASLAMANALSLRVVAEGVETNTQLSLLRELAVDYVQGYYLARPMPLDGYESLLQ